MVHLNDLRQQIFENAFLYKTEKFRLKSGVLSNYYLDLRKSTTNAHILVSLSPTLARKLPPDGIDYIASVELGGVMPATGMLYAYKLMHGRGLKNLIVRKESKGHGVDGNFAGEIPEAGTEIILVEDVITSGSSVKSSLEKLWKAGFVVPKVLAIADRSCDGGQDYIDFKNLLDQNEVELDCLFKFEEFLAMYKQQRMTQQVGIL